jgi:hypothetical protein
MFLVNPGGAGEIRQLYQHAFGASARMSISKTTTFSHVRLAAPRNCLCALAGGVRRRSARPSRHFPESLPMPCIFLRQVHVGEIGEEIRRAARLKRSMFLFHILLVGICHSQHCSNYCSSDLCLRQCRRGCPWRPLVAPEMRVQRVAPLGNSPALSLAKLLAPKQRTFKQTLLYIASRCESL